MKIMTREVKLYEIPKIPEVARVLDDSVLESYNESVKSDFNCDRARATLMKFEKQDGELTGSNPFMLVHLQNSGLLKGARITLRQDLETALRFNPDIFAGNCIDFALALRTAGDSYSPNDLIAKTLAEQLNQRAIKLGKGKLIPISALKLREDENSHYGLVFNLNDSARNFEDLSQFKWYHQRDKGIARAYLDGVDGWDSSNVGLSGSVGYGRVVVVSGEASVK